MRAETVPRNRDIASCRHLRHVSRFPIRFRPITTQPESTYSTPDTISITDTGKRRVSVTNDIEAYPSDEPI
jgi:hypothetical protein